MYLVHNDGDITWTLSAACSAFPQNCGGGLVTSLVLQKHKKSTKDAYGWGSNVTQEFTLKEAFDFLDSQKTKIFDQIVHGSKERGNGDYGCGTKGFYVLSDCVANPRSIYKSKLVDIDEESKGERLDTSGFVAWLIAREHGAVWRGPVTNNPVHPGNSVTCWMWVMHENQLHSDDVGIFKPGTWKEPTTGERGRKFVTKEKLLRELYGAKAANTVLEKPKVKRVRKPSKAKAA